MSLKLPKKWKQPLNIPEPDPSIDLSSCVSGKIGFKYMFDKLIMQFFDEIDDLLIYKNDYGENPLEVISYKKDDYWIVVHPSATDIIKSLDNLNKLGIYDTRDIVKVPNDLVNVPQYWESEKKKLF
jgi:hypothetical protein